MKIHDLYMTISKELKQLDSAEGEASQTASLRKIQAAMDQYKAQQTRIDFENLRGFFDGDGLVTENLPELDDPTLEDIEIPLRHNTPLKLFFDNTSIVMLAGVVLLEEGLSSPKDTD